MDMDLCGSAVFFPKDGDLLLDPCQSLLLDPCSDAGYHSACSSSLSPTSSVDSGCLSPPAQSFFGGFGGVQEISECFGFLGDSALSSEVAVEPVEENRPVRRGRKPRSKYPGKKRQSASEREKLRMRDLTKALHHLRTYLPASVAPVGQTLTKIETLRLTIRYIAHLSDQLALSEETLTQRSPASDHHQQQLQASSPLLHPANTHTQHPHSVPYSPSTAQQHRLQASPQEQQLQAANLHFQVQQLQQLQPQAYSPAQEALPAHVSPHSGSLQHGFPLEHLPEHTHASYQNPCDITYAQDMCSIPQQYWAPPQNMFYGLC